MRVWDLPPEKLCRNHLLGEHREIHAIWNVITMGKKGYSRHPEVMRWRGRLAALHRRHEWIANEMRRREYRHASELDQSKAQSSPVQAEFVNSLKEQKENILNKGCACSLQVE